MATTTYLGAQPPSLTTELVEAVWEEILKDIKARDRTLFVLLTSSGGVRLSVKGDKVLLHVRNKWQVQRIMQSAPRRVIELSINQLLNMSVSITATCDEINELETALEFYQLKREQWVLPNEEELKEEIAHYKEIIKTKTRHYKALERQSAKFDIHVPTHIILSMEDIQEEIRVADEKIKEIKHSMTNARFKYINPGESAESHVASSLEVIRNQATQFRQQLEACLILKVKMDKHFAALEELHELIKKAQEYKELRRKSIQLTLVSAEVQRLAEEVDFLANEISAIMDNNTGAVFSDTLSIRLDELKSIVTMKDTEQNDMEQLHLGIKSVLSLLKLEIKEIEQI
jgi:hypothetical protein